MKTKRLRTAKTISCFDFMEMFPTEGATIKYLEDKLWGNGRKCPQCSQIDNSTSCKSKKGFYQCKNCRKEFSVKIGTIFESSRVPLKKWFYSIYLLQTSRKGISSMQLSKEIGVTQKTAWFILQRLREACGVLDQKMYGVIEIDETYIGGKEKNRHESKKKQEGRGPAGKTPIIGIREREGNIKGVCVKNTTKEVVHDLINNTVEKKSVIYTDEHRSYLGLKNYKHSFVNHSAKEYVRDQAHTNGIESVWAVLKRGYNGIYHHWSKKHMQKYINEFMFRFNEGNCSNDTIDRIDSLLRLSKGKRLTYKGLIYG